MVPGGRRLSRFQPLKLGFKLKTQLRKRFLEPD